MATITWDIPWQGLAARALPPLFTTDKACMDMSADLLAEPLQIRDGTLWVREILAAGPDRRAPRNHSRPSPPLAPAARAFHQPA